MLRTEESRFCHMSHVILRSMRSFHVFRSVSPLQMGSSTSWSMNGPTSRSLSSFTTSWQFVFPPDSSDGRVTPFPSGPVTPPPPPRYVRGSDTGCPGRVGTLARGHAVHLARVQSLPPPPPGHRTRPVGLVADSGVELQPILAHCPCEYSSGSSRELMENLRGMGGAFQKWLGQNVMSTNCCPWNNWETKI